MLDGKTGEELHIPSEATLAIDSLMNQAHYLRNRLSGSRVTSVIRIHPQLFRRIIEEGFSSYLTIGISLSDTLIGYSVIQDLDCWFPRIVDSPEAKNG